MFFDYLVHLLTAFSFFHSLHKYLFCGHKGQFHAEMTLNLLWKYNHLRSNIYIQLQDCICQQKSLRNIHAAYGRVIQGTFEPLIGKGGGKVGWQPH